MNLKTIVKNGPDWLYFIVFSIYWAMKRGGEKVIVLTFDNAWLRIFPRRKIFAPKCRSRRSAFDNNYERYLKLEPEDVVVDAGACIGDITVPFAMKSCKVIAIEPDARNLGWLKQNLAINHLRNVEIVETALWRCNTTLTFHISEEDYMMHSVIAEKQMTMKVRTRTLDDICVTRGIAKIDFLKMDIEGAEIEALQGATRTLQITRKIVIAAYHLRDGKPTWHVVQQILMNNGFKTLVSSDGLVHAWKTQ